MPTTCEGFPERNPKLNPSGIIFFKKGISMPPIIPHFQKEGEKMYFLHRSVDKAGKFDMLVAS
jgi:hypothetical protein